MTATIPTAAIPTAAIPTDCLLGWYDGHRRSLPWRAPPGARQDPYKVWLSEIMLQQTTVTAVGPYYARFLARWPTVSDLAAAPLDAVLAEWAGLGYYARARNLHACARAVVERHGGRFPADRAALEALPGIGAYSSGAILAIAFDGRAAAVDGNAERVIARLYGVADPLPDAKPLLRRLGEAMAPAQRPGDFVQAMMDLGATVCTPRNPRCGLCPWETRCRARADGVAETLPRRAPRRPRPARQGVAFWLVDSGGAVLIRRRPETGLLGGMMEFPSTDWTASPPSAEAIRLAAPCAVDWRPMPGGVRHVFTHFELTMSLQTAGLGRAGDPALGVWAPIDRLGDYALPSLMVKIARHALSNV